MASDPTATLVDGPAPERLTFEESLMAGEPDSDRKLVFDDGTATRERMKIVDARAEKTMGDAAPTAFSLEISHAMLDENDAVVMDGDLPVLAPVHEVLFTNDALGRLGTDEAVDAAILDTRQIAAAQAKRAFLGATLAKRNFARAAGSASL